MKRNMLWTGALLVLTAAGFMASAASADAQYGRGYRGPRGGVWGNPGSVYYGGYNRGYYAPRTWSYYSYPRYYGSYYYNYPQYYYPTYRRSYYPGYYGTYWPYTFVPPPIVYVP